MDRSTIGMNVRIIFSGQGWGYSIEGVRQGSRLYRTQREAAAAARRAVKRKVAQHFDEHGDLRPMSWAGEINRIAA
jgi:hypothetical protein